MRRFELIEGTAAKFWEVEVDAANYSVRYGRLGTAGQSLSKTAADAAKAQLEVDKLIKEKTGKGYTEVGASALLAAAATATAAVVAPAAAAKTPKPPKIAAKSAAVVVVAESEPASPPLLAAPELAAASTGFQIAPAWKKLFYAQRGLAWKAPVKDLPTLFRAALALTEKDHHLEWVIRNDPKIEAFFKALMPPAKLFTAAHLQSQDRAIWHAAIAHGCMRWNQHDSCPLIEFALAQHGTGFVLEMLLSVIRDVFSDISSKPAYLLLARCPYLAAALAAAPEAEYQALRQSIAVYGDSDPVRYALGAIFNTDAQLVQDAIAAMQQLPEEHLRGHELAQALMSLAQAELVFARISKQSYYVDPIRVFAINVALHFGDAALPMLVQLIDAQTNSDAKRKLAEVIGALNSRAATRALLARIEDKAVQAAIDRCFESNPLLALASALEELSVVKKKQLEPLCKRWIAGTAEQHDALLTLLDAAAISIFERLRGDASTLVEAALEELPSVLTDPPWLKAVPKSVRPLLPSMALPSARMVWQTGQQEQWAQHLPNALEQEPAGKSQLAQAGMALQNYGVGQEGRAILAAAMLENLTTQLPTFAEYLKRKNIGPTYHDIAQLAALAPAARLVVWNTLGFAGGYWNTDSGEKGVLALHELDALPGLLRNLELSPSVFASALVVAAPELATRMATLLHTRKKLRAAAGLWLKTHTELSTIILLMETQTGAPKAKVVAEYVLHWLRQNSELARMQAGAQHYGAAGSALLTAIFAADPLAALPQKPRPFPSFFIPAGFSRPRLLNGNALPLAALSALGTMLQVSTLDDTYAGIELLKAACTAESLDAFAWDLFQAWAQTGASSKETWAFTAIGLLGGDVCVRQLTPLIRAWPGESQHARAVTGLDVLAAIGSDYALMQLNGIAQKSKFKGLQERAVEKIQAIADARGLTPEELADRLVPDFDLDESGTCRLDFGPRYFTVGFDEALRPIAMDSSGARLKDLPKPIKSDDAEKANAASERWKGLKKDVKTIASNQVQRLELAMCTDRRWPVAVFEQFFVRHPLLRHLVRRLCWAAVSPNGALSAFRVAEDATYAGADDSTFSIPQESEITLPHRLHLPVDVVASFGQIFADYEIIQPFAQLGREVYTLDEAERKRVSIDRYKGKRVASGSIYGLAHRGWRSGGAQDGGWIGWFEKDLADDLQAQIGLDPGLNAGDASYEPKQALTELTLHKRNTWGKNGERSFSSLGAVALSELLRDLDRLAVLPD